MRSAFVQQLPFVKLLVVGEPSSYRNQISLAQILSRSNLRGIIKLQ